MEIKIPKAPLKIINMLNASGYEAYVVGGCVRDSLMGRTPNDWDVTTSATPMEVKNVFKRTVDTGIKHGTVTVLEDGDMIEVTTYRIDGEYADGRHPDKVEFTRQLSEDLKRRDFTVNAMAYHPTIGLVDLFGGTGDIEKKIIRCVGDPKERFGEDALRMMRAVRFAAALGFEIEEKTWLAIKELAGDLSKISGERIREEMVKTLVSDNPYKFKLFYESGLTAVFMPEFDRCMETDQKHIHHCYSVGEHILHSMEGVEPKRELRLAMLFHDMAKPKMLTVDDDGTTHFYNHPKEGSIMAREIMRRLKFDNATIDRVSLLALYHDRDIELTGKAMRRAMNIIGTDNMPDLFKVKYADVMAQSTYMREEKLKKIEDMKTLYEEVVSKNEAVTIKDLAVNGRDLMDAGMKPGTDIGETLKKMLDDVIEEPAHNDKKYLIEKYVTALVLFISVIFMMSGCTVPGQSVSGDNGYTGYVSSLPGNYDSADTAVIININDTDGQIQFKTLANGKYYTLGYDGATCFYDKFGSAVSLMQLTEGEIVDVTFMKNSKRLNTLKESADVFSFAEINNYEIHAGGFKMYIGSDDYYISDDIVVMTSEGERSIEDINPVDVLTVQGYDHTIRSITVTKGHGYLRLTNNSYFVDGWVEIGQDMIYKVTEDMLITVPEGNISVTVSKSGSSGTEDMNITPGHEYELDVSKWQNEVQTGLVLFTTSPSKAHVYIDGEEVDKSEAVELDYGIHQLMVMADGYTTVTNFIRVGSPSANLDVVLEKEDSGADDTVSDNQTASSNTVSGNSQTDTTPVSPSPSPSVSTNQTASGNSASSNTVSSNSSQVINPTSAAKVYINSPEGAEVYVDGTYIGLSPVSFNKKAGSVVVTFRKNGYQTRSYTLSLTDDNKSENYSFSELVPIP